MSHWLSKATGPHSTTKGYKNIIIHVSFLQVLHDGILSDFGEQDHVIHSTVLDIVALPVVSVVPFAALQESTRNITKLLHFSPALSNWKPLFEFQLPKCFSFTEFYPLILAFYENTHQWCQLTPGKELHCPPKLEGNSMGFCDHLHTEWISDGRHF